MNQPVRHRAQAILGVRQALFVTCSGLGLVLTTCSLMPRGTPAPTGAPPTFVSPLPNEATVPDAPMETPQATVPAGDDTSLVAVATADEHPTSHPGAPPSATRIPVIATNRPKPTLPPPIDTPTHQPIPSPVSLIPPAGVRVYETSLVLNTYGYQNALVPSAPDDPIYPYPRLDFAAVSGPAPVSYQAVVLENAYVQVIILPKLGGRIIRWTDKTTGRVLTYQNPVIKPTRWGYRGWWLATGGFEWCLPVEEHGLNEYRPWTYVVHGTSVTVSDHEDRTGLDVSVTVSLDGSHSWLVLQPEVTNKTTEAQPLQFWINAMLSLAHNRAGDGIRFTLPAAQVMIHTTDNGDLPGPGGVINWPVPGRDLSTYANWYGYLGFFADPVTDGYVGAYDTSADQGVVRIFPPGVAPGVKVFGGKGLDPGMWTDDDSTYFELWGGWTRTFWATGTLPPGGRIAWTERWYPLTGLASGFDYANAEAALRLDDRGDIVWVGIVPSHNLLGARAVLFQEGQVMAEWRVTAGPGRAFSALWPKTGTGGMGLRLLDAQGQVLAQMGMLP